MQPPCAAGVWNPGEGGIATPALFLIRPDWSVAFQKVGTGFADRPTDEELFSVAAEATRHAGGAPPMPLENLVPYTEAPVSH